MNLIDKIPFNHFKPIVYRNEELWKSYEQLNGFLSKNFESEFSEIIAKPFYSDNAINWYSINGGTFKPLDIYAFAEKQNLLLRYHFFLHQVNTKVSELKSSANQDNMIWADMLSLAFTPANNILYSDGQNFVLVWGFNFSNQQENYLDPSVISGYIQSKLNPTSDLPTDQTLSDIDNFEDLNIENLLDSPPSIFNKKIIVRSNKKQEARNSFFRNYWWLFLFIPLFILLLLNCCNSVGESSIGTIPANLFKRPPIDTSKLIKGDSGISLIVSDIFNIALKDKSKDLSVFSTELKKQFPDSGYQIVYYDTSTLRIQFKFPDSNRTALKSKIKEKMDNYELLIWDESIFRASKTFNDPALLDVEKSWYLSAIGVYDAWEKTTGKKDLAMQAMAHGNAYVAEIAMGANDVHALKTILEAEAFPGPSIIIAYSHCIAHGYDMCHGLDQQALAVKSGYWPLFRFNPMNEKGKRFMLDSKDPSIPMEDFMYNENRFATIKNNNPERAHEFLDQANQGMHTRLEKLLAFKNL